LPETTEEEIFAIFDNMKNTLGSTLMILLLIVTLLIFYTIEVGADFSHFNTKAVVKSILYLVLPIVVISIGNRISRKKEE